MVNFKKSIFFKVPEGLQHFPGGGGGVQLLISLKLHKTV